LKLDEQIEKAQHDLQDERKAHELQVSMLEEKLASILNVEKDDEEIECSIINIEA
jgi:hypothetical protein